MTTTSVTGLARSVKSDIDACYEALKDASIHKFMSLSQQVRFIVSLN